MLPGRRKKLWRGQKRFCNCVVAIRSPIGRMNESLNGRVRAEFYIFLGAAAAGLAILAARKRTPYYYGLAIAFAIYVLYDLAQQMQVDFQEGLRSVLFLSATVITVVATWGLYVSRYKP
jgi:xanthine/uracil/vitamin C permease (AzgA family)